MARKTRAQLVEESRARVEKFEQNARLVYPVKLMNILERATGLGYELTVKNSLFHVTSFRFKDVWTIPLEYSSEGQYSLEQFTWEIESEETARFEEERMLKLKESALNKLTKEERKLLGLK